MTKEHPLGLLACHLGCRSALSADDVAAILAMPYTERRLRASDYIVREGGRPGPCAVLRSGFAMRQKLTRDGSRQIVSLHLPGEALDLQMLYLDIADHNVQAMTDASVVLVAREDFQRLLLHYPAVGRASSVQLQVEASMYREWLLNVGRRDARAQTAHLICELAVRLEQRGMATRATFELPLSQEQIADILSLTPVHVNRSLRALEDEGAIRRNKRNVQVPDWQRLAAIAEFDNTYLHLAAPDPLQPRT